MSKINFGKITLKPNANFSIALQIIVHGDPSSHIWLKVYILFHYKKWLRDDWGTRQ